MNTATGIEATSETGQLVKATRLTNASMGSAAEREPAPSWAETKRLEHGVAESMVGVSATGGVGHLVAWAGKVEGS